MVDHDTSPRSAKALAERAALFRLLGHLFLRELDTDLLKRLAEGGFLDEVVEDPEARAALSDPTQKLLDELAVTYAAILIGPGAHVAPYGSVHHPGDKSQGRLWGETTTWLRRFAIDHGLEFKGPGYHGVPDHIGIELELIAKLLARASELTDAGEDVRAQQMVGSLTVLVEQHTQPWVGPFRDRMVSFAARVKSGPGRAFYQGLARLTASLVDDECRALGIQAAPTPADSDGDS